MGRFSAVRDPAELGAFTHATPTKPPQLWNTRTKQWNRPTPPPPPNAATDGLFSRTFEALAE